MWMITFCLLLSTVIISVNMSELMSANCIRFWPLRSGRGAFCCELDMESYAPAGMSSRPISTWNIPSGGFYQKNCLLKSERAKPAPLEALRKSFACLDDGPSSAAFAKPRTRQSSANHIAKLLIIFSIFIFFLILYLFKSYC